MSSHFQIQQSFFIATPKGYEISIDPTSDIVFPKNPNSIDVRVFDYDWLVLRLRNLFEKSGQTRDWRSDQTMMKNQVLLAGLEKDYFPDGMCLSFEGKKYAFELELSIKDRKLCIDKIQKYVRYIREKQNKTEALKRVHYVASKTSFRNSESGDKTIF